MPGRFAGQNNVISNPMLLQFMAMALSFHLKYAYAAALKKLPAKLDLERLKKVHTSIADCVASMAEVDCGMPGKEYVREQPGYVWKGSCDDLPLDYFLVAKVNQLSILLL
jgi:hypothetical protein